MSRKEFTRRTFLAGAAVTLAGCATAPKKAPGVLTTPLPSERINLATIGCGGQGGRDLAALAHIGSVNVVALCDVDSRQAATAFNSWPDVPKYKDFRVMLEKEKSIDVVNVGTPDNVHAVAAMTAMAMGKHVYVQKPLALTIHETRMLTNAAREYGVITQMGNQGHTFRGVREICEMIWDGAIGQVPEVHCWTDRPGGGWVQGVTEPLAGEPVPGNLDWDLWIGPAPMRPYNHGYHPHKWRGWWDFGTGALGDMGCHIMDPANWALQLGPPATIECVKEEGTNDQTGPRHAIIKYEFPAREWNKIKFCPTTLYWYEGGLTPPRPEGIGPDVELGDGGNGTLFIGEKGMITCGTYGGGPRLLPEELHKDYNRPDPYLPRLRGPYEDWITACQEGRPACSDFGYAGPLTETVLLGVVAMRTRRKIVWDSPNMGVADAPEAMPLLRRTFRDGWELPTCV